MGLKDIFNNSDSDQIRKGSKEGNQIGIRAGALPNSQMHAQGNIGDEVAGFGRIDKGFIAATPAEATNLNFKSAGEYSTLDLDGQTPSKYLDNKPQ